jgi:hypothetical protein
LIHLPPGPLFSSSTPWRYIHEILFPPNLRLLRRQRRYPESSGLCSGTVKVQRVDASTEFLVSASSSSWSSSSSSSSTSVDGMGVEIEADGIEVLEHGEMHPFGRVADSGVLVSGVFGYFGVSWKASVAWVVLRALRGGEFMMAKLASSAIGGTRSCESRKSGSAAGNIRVSACISSRRLRAVVCDPLLVGALLKKHVIPCKNSLPNKYVKHSQAA